MDKQLHGLSWWREEMPSKGQQALPFSGIEVTGKGGEGRYKSEIGGKGGDNHKLHGGLFINDPVWQCTVDINSQREILKKYSDAS